MYDELTHEEFRLFAFAFGFLNSHRRNLLLDGQHQRCWLKGVSSLPQSIILNTCCVS
jgi:hypothetical protein